MRGTKTSLFMLGLLLASGLAQADWIQKSDINAMLILEASAQFNPEGVASQGLDEFDGDIMDLKPKVHQRSQDSDKALLKEMNKRLATETHPKVHQDIEILIQALQDGINSADIHRANMLPYYNLHKILYSSFNSLLNPRNDKARYSGFVYEPSATH